MPRRVGAPSNPRLGDLPDVNHHTDAWPPAEISATVELHARYDCKEPASVGCSWRVYGRYGVKVASVEALHERIWCIVQEAIDNCDRTVIGEIRARAWFHTHHSEGRTWFDLRYEQSTPEGRERWRLMHGWRS